MCYDIYATCHISCGQFFLHFQGAIAKKPYNPILGEVFRCYWDLPGQDKAASEEAGKVSD